MLFPKRRGEMRKVAVLMVTLACLIGSAPRAFGENDFSISGSVMNVHEPDGGFRTYFHITIGDDFPGTLPDDIDSITVTGPSGELPYTKEDFTFLPQLMQFFLSVTGSPETEEYTFAVESGTLSATAADTQDINIDIPVPDTSTFSFSDHTFSWGPVECPGIPLYYQLEIYDLSGWRVFYTSIEQDMLSCTISENVLQPGETYKWRVRVMDSSDFIEVQNRANSSWLTIGGSVASVTNLHYSDGSFYTLLVVQIGAGIAATIPDDIHSITVTGPSGELPCTKEDFTYIPQWRNFYTLIPGSPQIGVYTFTVTGGTSSVTLTDTQDINRDIPVPDSDTLSPAQGAVLTSTTPTFSWGPVEYPGIPLYYRLEILDRSGWRVFYTSRERDMLSCTVPEGILKLGETYKWYVQVSDDSDWVKAQNRSHSESLALTMASPNSPPDKPSLNFPSDGATGVSLTPTLRTGEFSDPNRGDTHLKTEWDISTEADFSATVLQRTSATHLTSLPLPQFILREGTTYYWRVRFYDNHLNVSGWSDPFSFTTQTTATDLNANGIPDARENDTVDLDSDGTNDLAQEDIKSMNTAVGDGQMGVSRRDEPAATAIDAIDSIDPATISEIARPSDMPLGLFAIRLAVASAGQSIEIVVYFSDPAPPGHTWLMYDPIKGWVDYSEHATFSGDRMSVTLELKDGDYGDADGVANGIIVDPGGFGLASWLEGLITDASTGEGIARAQVSISELDFTTDLTGHYLSMIYPGTYQMTVSAPGYEPFIDLSVEVLEGETVTLDIALNSTRLYFPHVDTTSPWETEIAIINVSPTPLTGTLKGYSNTGTLIDTMGISLAPHGRRQITISQELANPTSIGYLVFEAGSGDACGYTKFYVSGQYRAAVPAVEEVNTSDIYVSHIDSSNEWWTGMSLLNTTGSAKTLAIDFDTGQSRSVTLAPGEHQSFTIASLFEGQSQPDIHSAVITNANGVVGLELFGSGNQLSGVLLKDDTASTLYYPHVASDETWWTGIVAYNPASSPAILTITPYTDTGTALATQTREIPPGGKYVGTVSSIGLPPGTAWFKIGSTNPITGFELFGTTDGNQLAGYTGVGISGKEGVFAKIEKDGWTGIAFVNIEGTTASVMLTAYDNYGNAIAAQTISLGSYAKVVDLPENIFTQDIGDATYIGYASDREIVGFQLNGSSDGMMLDGLPGM
jgi:hypothetical protein